MTTHTQTLAQVERAAIDDKYKATITSLRAQLAAAEAERDRTVKRLAHLAAGVRGVDLYNLLYPHYDLSLHNYAEAIDAALASAAGEAASG